MGGKVGLGIRGGPKFVLIVNAHNRFEGLKSWWPFQSLDFFFLFYDKIQYEQYLDHQRPIWVLALGGLDACAWGFGLWLIMAVPYGADLKWYPRWCTMDLTLILKSTQWIRVEFVWHQLFLSWKELDFDFGRCSPWIKKNPPYKLLPLLADLQTLCMIFPFQLISSSSAEWLECIASLNDQKFHPSCTTLRSYLNCIHDEVS